MICRYKAAMYVARNWRLWKRCPRLVNLAIFMVGHISTSFKEAKKEREGFIHGMR